MTTITFARMGSVSDQVRAEAKKLDPVKALLTALMVVPFVLGWLAAQTVRLFWFVAAFVWTAALIGWRTARSEDST